jgi:hypothetical protein
MDAKQNDRSWQSGMAALKHAAWTTRRSFIEIADGSSPHACLTRYSTRVKPSALHTSLPTPW